MAIGKLKQVVADGSVRFSPVVIEFNLTTEQSLALARYTGRIVKNIEMSEEDLKLVMGIRSRYKVQY